MKIETHPRDDQQVKVIAELEAGALEKFKQQAARKMAQQAKVPGFRPGKAPYNVIQRMYGDEAIQQEAMELLVDDIYPKVIDEAKINPSGPGALEEIVSYDPPTVAFIIPLEPEVILGDYKSIRAEYAPEPVTDTQLEDTLRRVRTSYSTAEPVERPVEKGDLVYYQLIGKQANPAEGEEMDLIRDTPMQSIIGESTISDNDWPFENFSDNLIGMSAGEEKTFDYTYSDDSKYDRLAGKTVQFHVKLTSVKHLHMPEIDDAFAQSMGGDFETVDQMRDALRKQLEDSSTHEYEHHYFDELVERVTDLATVKFPPHMLEEQTERTLNSFRENLARQQMDLEAYLKMVKKDLKTLVEEEIKPIAETRLKQSLVLDEIARAENIQLGKEELEMAFNQTAAEITSAPDFKDLQKKTKPEQLANAIAMEAASRLLNRRVLDRLKAIATGTADQPAENIEEEAQPSAE